MLVRIVLWNLADSKASIGELRRYLYDESVEQFAQLEGLRFKAWVSNKATEHWGAIYFWETAATAAVQQQMPSRARELIGKDPDLVEEFDLEASIEGRFEIDELSRLGLAFE